MKARTAVLYSFSKHSTAQAARKITIQHYFSRFQFKISPGPDGECHNNRRRGLVRLDGCLFGQPPNEASDVSSLGQVIWLALPPGDRFCLSNELSAITPLPGSLINAPRTDMTLFAFRFPRDWQPQVLSHLHPLLMSRE